MQHQNAPLVPLELLRRGECGRVADVEGRAEVVTRLAEMGLRLGAEIRMLQPGSPCLVAIDDHRLSFRGEEAALVLVEVIAASRA